MESRGNRELFCQRCIDECLDAVYSTRNWLTRTCMRRFSWRPDTVRRESDPGSGSFVATVHDRSCCWVNVKLWVVPSASIVSGVICVWLSDAGVLKSHIITSSLHSCLVPVTYRRVASGMVRKVCSMSIIGDALTISLPHRLRSSGISDTTSGRSPIVRTVVSLRRHVLRDR